MDEAERIDRLERLLQDAQTDARRQQRAARRSAEAWARNQCLTTDRVVIDRVADRAVENWAEANPGLARVAEWVRGSELSRLDKLAAEQTGPPPVDSYAASLLVRMMPSAFAETGIVHPTPKSLAEAAIAAVAPFDPQVEVLGSDGQRYSLTPHPTPRSVAEAIRAHEQECGRCGRPRSGHDPEENHPWRSADHESEIVADPDAFRADRGLG